MFWGWVCFVSVKGEGAQVGLSALGGWGKVTWGFAPCWYGPGIQPVEVGASLRRSCSSCWWDTEGRPELV